MDNTIDYKGYKITIDIDEYAESPREWDNLSRIVAFHNRYSFPVESTTPIDKGDFDSWEELENYLIAKEDVLRIFPIYMYDHSGISLSMGRGYPYNDKWDSGQIGFIYVTREDVKKEYSTKRITKKIEDQAIKVLQSEFNTFNEYVEGEIYQYTIEQEVLSWDLDRNEYSNMVFIDSCGNLYGYDECIEEAKSNIDNIIEGN